MKKILFIDSGLGGATIIKELMQKGKNFEIIFHVENKFAPLGNKSKEKLNQICFEIVNKYVKEYDIQMLVLACNTLTSACIENLRKSFSFDIIGVEPNVKVKDGKTLVLATPYTIKNGSILQDKNFIKQTLPKLSKKIDKTYPSLQKCYQYIQKKLKKYKDFDNIILGCTHYVLIAPFLQNLYKGATIYDSVTGVVNQILRKIENINWQMASLQIVLSKNDEKLYKKIVQYLSN